MNYEKYNIDKEKMFKGQKAVKKHLEQYKTSQLLTQNFSIGRCYEKYVVSDGKTANVIFFEIYCGDMDNWVHIFEANKSLTF